MRTNVALLCSLIYVYRNNSVLEENDLVNIMNLGN